MLIYRAMESEHPSEQTFLSHAALGRQPQRPFDALEAIEWEGVSVYDTIAAARRAAHRYNLGAYYVALEIPEDGSVAIAQSLSNRRHYYNVWAEATILLACEVERGRF